MRTFQFIKVPKDTLLISAVSVILGVTLLGGAAVYRFNASKEKKQQTTTNQASNTQAPSPTPTTSSVASIDEITANEFFEYKNPSLGISLKLPKTAVNEYGGCQYIGAYGSYTSQFANTPVQVYDDVKNGLLYISFEHYYQLAGTENASGSITYSDCKLVKNSLDAVTSAMKSKATQTGVIWTLKYRKVQNDTELARFAKDMHGEACIVKEKEEVTKGIYDIHIASNGSDDSCTLNYNLILAYNENKKMAVSWSIGQNKGLFREYDIDNNIFQAYDSYVIKSFKME